MTRGTPGTTRWQAARSQLTRVSTASTGRRHRAADGRGGDARRSLPRPAGNSASAARVLIVAGDVLDAHPTAMHRHSGKDRRAGAVDNFCGALSGAATVWGMDWQTALIDQVAWHGGTAGRRDLAAFTGRQLAKAVQQGLVVREAPGRYALSDADRLLRAARRLGGVRSHRSAALAYGWGVATKPARAELIVPRGRRVSRADQRDHAIRWRDIGARERREALTAPLRTVIDCARDLPFEEGLPVADSALRAGAVSIEELTYAAERCRTRGAAAVRAVAERATGKAANPFESRLRALTYAVPRLAVEPQVRIGRAGFAATVDLADPRLGIVLEADSYEWHAGTLAFAEDMRRYDELVALGWVVLRFGYGQVFFADDWVRAMLAAVVAGQDHPAVLRRPTWRASILDDTERVDLSA